MNAIAHTVAKMTEDRRRARVAHPLLDHIRQANDLKTDGDICRIAKIDRPVISKVRRRTVPVGATVMVRLHEAFGISFKEMRQLLQGENVSV